PIPGVPDPVDPLAPPLFPTIDFTGTIVVSKGNSEFVYVTDRVTGFYPAGNVYAFKLNADATLTPIPNVAAGTPGFDAMDAEGVAVGLAQIGNFLIVGNRSVVGGSDTITVFPINTDGSLGDPTAAAFQTFAGIATVYTAGTKIYLPNCDGGGQLTVLNL